MMESTSTSDWSAIVQWRVKNRGGVRRVEERKVEGGRGEES